MSLAIILPRPVGTQEINCPIFCPKVGFPIDWFWTGERIPDRRKNWLALCINRAVRRFRTARFVYFNDSHNWRYNTWEITEEVNVDEASVTPWPDEGTPGEARIREIYQREGLIPYRWSNRPGDVYPSHQHTYHKVIYVVQGSITFGLPVRGAALSLGVGDRLDLPAGIVHDARVGPQGVVCLEARRG